MRRERLSDAATAHLSACAGCSVFGEERLALKRLIGGLEKVSAPADFDYRVRARLAAETSAKRSPRARRFNFSPAALSWPVAACCALVISATFYFQQQRQPYSPDATTGQSRAVAALATPRSQQDSIDEATSPITQSVPSQTDETDRSAEATLMKNALAARTRVPPALRIAGRTTVDAARIREGVEESNSTSLLGNAPVRYAGNNTAKGESASIPVQVSAQERPLKVLLQETGGSARTISVESVSFGSRDVIGRPATISKASLSTNQGVW